MTLQFLIDQRSKSIEMKHSQMGGVHLSLSSLYLNNKRVGRSPKRPSAMSANGVFT